MISAANCRSTGPPGRIQPEPARAMATPGQWASGFATRSAGNSSTAAICRRVHVTARLWLLLTLLLAGCTRAPEEQLSFNASIQPILSENCYGCHGPDSGSRKAELRLDRAELAYQPHGKFGPAIVPGEPDKSPLVQRIEAQDPQERMPPPEAHKSLTT